MTGRDTELLRTFADRVRELLPDAEVTAFGSRVTGAATWESDLDVCVVSQHMNKEFDSKVSDIAWEVGFERDVVISTVTYTRDEYDRGALSKSPLVRSIKKLGIAA